MAAGSFERSQQTCRVHRLSEKKHVLHIVYLEIVVIVARNEYYLHVRAASQQSAGQLDAGLASELDVHENKVVAGRFRCKGKLVRIGEDIDPVYAG